MGSCRMSLSLQKRRSSFPRKNIDETSLGKFTTLQVGRNVMARFVFYPEGEEA